MEAGTTIQVVVPASCWLLQRVPHVFVGDTRGAIAAPSYRREREGGAEEYEQQYNHIRPPPDL